MGKGEAARRAHKDVLQTKKNLNTIMIETETSTVNPVIIAELLTRAGYSVVTVEAARGGIWRRDEVGERDDN